MATYLVTGCNRGIGLEVVRQLTARGDDVLAVCRQSSDELDATGAEVLAGIDVGQGADMEKLKSAVGNRKIDVLLNNAGILRRDAFGELDYEGMIEQFRVNTLGPLRVTEALADNLSEEFLAGLVESTPLGRGGDPEEVGDAVVYLSGDMGKWVTGREHDWHEPEDRTAAERHCGRPAPPGARGDRHDGRSGHRSGGFGARAN